MIQLVRIILKQGVLSQSAIQVVPVMGQKAMGIQLSIENLFRQVIKLLEQITKAKEFRADVVKLISEEAEFMRHLSSLQYTIQSRNLALRFTKFIKNHFSNIVLCEAGEAIFEFEFDLVSMTSVENISARVMNELDDAILMPWLKQTELILAQDQLSF